MSRIVFEGNYKVFWVDAVADPAAPTVAELTAATDITTFVPKDGLRYGPSFTKVDASDISTEFDPMLQGSWSMDGGLDVQHDDTNDTARELFAEHATAGVLVVLPYATGASPAADDTAFVMPAEASIAVPKNTAKNALQTSEVSLAFSAEPNFSASVAA